MSDVYNSTAQHVTPIIFRRILQSVVIIQILSARMETTFIDVHILKELIRLILGRLAIRNIGVWHIRQQLR